MDEINNDFVFDFANRSDFQKGYISTGHDKRTNCPYC